MTNSVVPPTDRPDLLILMTHTNLASLKVAGIDLAAIAETVVDGGPSQLSIRVDFIDESLKFSGETKVAIYRDGGETIATIDSTSAEAVLSYLGNSRHFDSLVDAASAVSELAATSLMLVSAFFNPGTAWLAPGRFVLKACSSSLEDTDVSMSIGTNVRFMLTIRRGLISRIVHFVRNAPRTLINIEYETITSEKPH